jgi:predicted TPR repeat methyltransferase
VIISADTLVYFGDLQPLVSAAADTLRAGGLLAFTVEKLSSSDESAEYLLQHHGRYCHSPWYVQRILETAGLVIESLDDAELRKQGSEMVAGLVVVARKPTDAT